MIRATKDNPDKIQILPVYGPKVFATRRRFKDPALEARCLTQVMEETDRDDIPPVLGRKFFKEQADLRNKLLLWRLRNYFTVEPEAEIELDLHSVEPRLRQVSQAFACLFASQPEVLESYRDFIQRHQRELTEQRAATKAGQVVEKLFELMGVSSGSSVSSTMGLLEVDTEISAGDIAEKVGLTPQAVGGILKGLGLTTEKKRIGDSTKRVIVFDQAKFQKLQRRYLLPDEDGKPRDVPVPRFPYGLTHLTQLTHCWKT